MIAGQKERVMSTHHGILIHTVFSTKLRMKVLRFDWQEELFRFIGGIVTEHKAALLRAGGIEDHVHLLLKIHPQFAISDTMQLLKANSSRWINEQRKIAAKFEWQKGYGAFSVSQSMSDSVKRYIDNQREHHQRISFEDEYIATLKKHGIEYDPRYVFDSEHIG
jgi:REP element-mobilizing transposase RayT